MLLQNCGGDFTCGFARRLGSLLRLDQFCQPKIENLRMPVARDHDVFWFQIAMDDSCGVRLCQSLSDVLQLTQKFGEIVLTTMNQFAQSLTVDELHRDEV